MDNPVSQALLDTRTLVFVSIFINLLMGLFLYAVFTLKQQQSAFIYWVNACWSFAVGSTLLAIGFESSVPYRITGQLFIGLSHVLVLLGLLIFVQTTRLRLYRNILFFSYAGLVATGVALITIEWLFGLILASFSSLLIFSAAFVLLPLRKMATLPVTMLLTIFVVHGLIMLVRAILYYDGNLFDHLFGIYEAEHSIFISHILLVICTASTLPLLAFVKTEKQLTELTEHDALTGLLNQRSFLHRAKQTFSEYTENQKLVLLMVDIKQFKSIIDAFGRDVGDEVLVEFAQKLKQHFRPDDIIARLGGEEFAILMCNIDLIAADKVAKRLEAEIKSTPMRVKATTIPISIATGLAAWKNKEQTPKDLLRECDFNIYQARKQSAFSDKAYLD